MGQNVAEIGRLAGRVAVVTGAGSGIGRAIAERFYGVGAAVVVSDMSGQEVDVARSLGERALAVRCDVTNTADIKRMLNAAVERFGGIDILCNNAGIDGDMRLIADIDEDNFDRVMAINLRGVFLGIKYAIPLLKKRGGGSIVNIASVAGITATPGLGVYGAAKAGVMQLTRSAAVEYAADKIRVNAICPAMIETPMVSRLLKTHPQDAARVLAVTPAGRVGQPHEVADAALYLACDESSYVTGISLPVDGAYTVL
jgi:NAD(P)-dependent dehydrogenase (short-subunit alcohol dehydrogenase family)